MRNSESLVQRSPCARVFLPGLRGFSVSLPRSHAAASWHFWPRASPRSSPDRRTPSVSAAQETKGGVLSKDRKSTRLNSSHTVISYAVFCLKKKKKKKIKTKK